MIIQPFFPAYGTCQQKAAAAASANATINKDNRQVRVVNTGTNIAYVQTYSSVDQAVTTASVIDLPVPGGMAVTFSKDIKHDTIAYISALGTTLEIMTGDGF